MRHWLIASLLLGGFAGLPVAPALAGSAPARCTFESLSPEDQRRYQSRYKRRVRIDGQAYADNWLREQVCMTAAERKAKRKPLMGKDGRPCTKTRLEMRVSPGFDGPMTMSPVPVCAH